MTLDHGQGRPPDFEPLMNTPDIKIYVTNYCGYCHMARRLLDAKGVDYETIHVDGDRAARTRLAQESGRRTVPQVFINGRPYGGYTDIAALDRLGQLDRILAGDLAAEEGEARDPH